MSELDQVERIQNFIFKDKGSYLPFVIFFVLGVLLSGWVVRGYYINKYTLDEAEHTEISNKLKAKNEELAGQLEIINDGHQTAIKQIESWKEQALIAQTEADFLKNNPQVEYLTQTERVYISPTDCQNLAHVKQARALYNENNIYYHSIID